jgi:hypothetical protein
MPYRRDTYLPETDLSKIYQRDPSLPFWRSNICVEQLLEDFAINGTQMRGHFEGGILGDHCFSWTFTPNREDEPALIFPVYDNLRLVDLLAISSHPQVWGCVVGAGSYVGTFASQLRVHRTPDSWLKSGTGILPLARSFFPMLQLADSIIADDAEHAEKIANEAFIYPAERFGLDCFAAERLASERISF